jgi:hypothetical protein
MFFRIVMMFSLIARNLLPPSSGQQRGAAVLSGKIPVYLITCITSQNTIPLLLIALITSNLINDYSLSEVNTKKHICHYMILYMGLEEEVSKINHCR